MSRTEYGKFDSFAPIPYMEQAKGHLMVGGATIFRVELQAVLIMDDVAVVLSAPLTDPVGPVPPRYIIPWAQLGR